MESGCVELDDQMNSDLLKIMDNNTERVKSDFAGNSFQRLFWEQQLKSTKVKDKRQMHWHPMIIKWCLHLKMLSSALTMPFEHLSSSHCHQNEHYVITLTLREVQWASNPMSMSN